MATNGTDSFWERKGRCFSEAQREKMYRMHYDDGMPISDIARVANCHYTAVLENVTKRRRALGGDVPDLQGAKRSHKKAQASRPQTKERKVTLKPVKLNKASQLVLKIVERMQENRAQKAAHAAQAAREQEELANQIQQEQNCFEYEYYQLQVELNSKTSRQAQCQDEDLDDEDEDLDDEDEDLDDEDEDLDDEDDDDPDEKLCDDDDGENDESDGVTQIDEVEEVAK